MIDAANGTAFRFFIMHKVSVDEGVHAVIGDCSLANIVRGAFQACHLGYNLDESHVGKGLMQEALRAVLSFAFETLLLHRVMANHLPDNDRSAKTLASLGFESEGLAKDYLFLGGAWRDHVLTSKLNPRPILPTA
jgi:ribosomal-protein-alanine N-acetyltransferase